MEERVVRRIRESIQQIEVTERDFSEVFYGRLFRGHPALRNIFPANMEEQRSKFWLMLSLIVEELTDSERLTALLPDLGRRHLSYGAKEGDYEIVAAVLLESLAEILGDTWSDELRGDWVQALAQVSNSMMRAERECEGQ